MRSPWAPTVVALLAGCSSAAVVDEAPPPSSAVAGAPALDVQVVLGGLDRPWDVARADDGTLLLDERAGGLTAVLPDGTVRQVQADFGDLFARGETGLMGLVLDPAFADGRRFYTCQGVAEDGGPEIQVIAWVIADDWSAATRVADPLIAGIPVNADSGRDGAQWGAYDGLLLLGALRGRGVLALRLDERGGLVEQLRLPELDGNYGRIRAVEQGSDGALYVTTDNGGGSDQLLRVTPR